MTSALMLEALMLICFHMAALQLTDFLFYQISESGLIEILEKVSQETDKKTTVKVSSTEVLPMFDSLSVTGPSYIFMLCTCQFNRQKVMDSDDEED